MNILIAGAGYLGSEIARQASPAHHIISLTKSGENNHHPCDLSSPDQVTHFSKNHPTPDLIIHCASSGRGGPPAYRSVFIEGCQNLITTFPTSHLLLTSSTSVYHQTDGSEVSETSPTHPIRETSQLLLQAERIVLAAGGTVARLAGLYGPKRSAILRKFLDHTAVIEESGQRILNQIHLSDAASASLHLATRKLPGIYNVSDNHPTSQLECYQNLATHFGKPLPPRGPKNTSRKRAWTHKKILNTKLRASGWTPSYPSYLHAISTLI